MNTFCFCSEPPPKGDKTVVSNKFTDGALEHLTGAKSVRDNFTANTEKVIKRFYTAFKKQHTALLGFIFGIDVQKEKEWYASVMLNRLMFCYFMQRRGFLNNDRHYLRNKLNESKQKPGKGKSHSFYRDFLLVLFHQGFGAKNRSGTIKAIIGDIPYLNGGLFELHEIEKTHPKLAIADEAFEKIFDLFDQYEWYLDVKECVSGNEINPDVLGYLFEKYINDRSSMGAYYTQEDITGYISRSTILPFLLESTKKDYPKAFEPNGTVGTFLKNSGDAYVFAAMKKGVELPLPKQIVDGLDPAKPDLLKRRKRWNESASAELALPAEIWREVVERRSRYEKVRCLIADGKMTEISDFVTYNLDIVGFVTDLLDRIEDPVFIQIFYQNLEKVTILDPTCGSGAFLFAALSILEPLYDSCLSRMEDYLSHNFKGILDCTIQRFFTEKLKRMTDAPSNKRYFIVKSIILNNLYGVDIMHEAVETAKLRLFLKLVSTTGPDYGKKNLGIEPLPDVDFNIKSGNALVGYANETEVDDALKRNCFTRELTAETKKAMRELSQVTDHYRQLQLGAACNVGNLEKAKNRVTQRQAKLNSSLNALLYKSYTDVQPADWAANYDPFHWVSEFYSIIVEKGGFDVVIGNPPYVAFSKIPYRLLETQYRCYSCRDVFALVLERGQSLSNIGTQGYIIPLSGFSVEGMQSLRNLYLEKSQCLWNSYFSASAQPSTLFNGVRHRLQILLSHRKDEKKCTPRCFTTNFIKWFSNERDALFKASINYALLRNTDTGKEKLSRPIEMSILDKVNSNKPIESYTVRNGLRLFYHNAPVSWHKAFDFVPYYSEAGIKKQSSHLKSIEFPNREYLSIALCVFNSTLFYWYNWHYSNCRDLSLRDILGMRLSLDELSRDGQAKLSACSTSLMQDFQSHSKIYKRVCRGVETEFDSFYPMFSKRLLNQIDTILAEHYGFTEEELDFIINYDIKYRMGPGENTDEDE